MQSRLACTTAKRSNWLSSVTAGGRTSYLLRPVAYVTTTTERTTSDPTNANVHTQEEEHGHNVGPLATTKEQNCRKSLHRTYPTVESTEVNPQPANPISQQKRRHSTAAETVASGGGDDERREEMERQKREQEDDNKEYFKHHKASPLSFIEVADTRKPVTRATDGTADAEDFGGGRDLVGFLPEQMDSTEDPLERAARLWKERAMRGDPDFPPSKVLRSLRGEDF